MRIYELNPILDGDILGSQVLALDDSTQTRKISLDQIRVFLGVGENSTLIPSGTDIHVYFLTAKSGSYYGEGLVNTAQGGAWAAFDWSTHQGERGTLIETNNVNAMAVHSLAAGAWTRKKILSEADKTQSQTDGTAGRVLKVGDWGLGAKSPRTAAIPAYVKNDYSGIPAGLACGFWTHQTQGGPYAHTFTLLHDGGGALHDVHLIIPTQPGDKMAARWDNTDGTFSYQYLYTDVNKPTAADINAIYQSQSSLTVDLNTLDGTKSGRYYQESNANATEEFHYPVAKAGTLDVYKNNATDGRGCVQEYRPYNTYSLFRRWYNAQPNGEWGWSLWVEEYNTSNLDISLYMKTIDANAKFVQGVQLGAQVVHTPPGNEVSWTFDCPTGNMLTGIVVQETGNGSADNIGGVRHKPIQRNINGVWATIPG